MAEIVAHGSTSQLFYDSELAPPPMTHAHFCSETRIYRSSRVHVMSGSAKNGAARSVTCDAHVRGVSFFCLTQLPPTKSMHVEYLPTQFSYSSGAPRRTVL